MSCGFQKMRVERSLEMNCPPVSNHKERLVQYYRSMVKVKTFIVKRGYNGLKGTNAIKQAVIF